MAGGSGMETVLAGRAGSAAIDAERALEARREASFRTGWVFSRARKIFDHT